MHVSMCTVVDSGRDNGLPFLIYGYVTLHEDEKKRKYASRIIEVENGTFTPLVFTTTGGMTQECQRYHSRLAELISSKKQETDCATTITWIRTKVSFAILRTALVCLRGTRSQRRKTNVQENDLEIEKGLAGLI